MWLPYGTTRTRHRTHGSTGSRLGPAHSARPGAADIDAVVALEANRQEGEGWIDDDLALVRPWGFEPEAIGVRVRLWHGDADVIIPPAHGRRLAQRIPAAEPCSSRVPGTGWSAPPGHAGLAGRALRGSHRRALGVE